MVGIALLLAFYSMMLWWRTQWQSSRDVGVLLLLVVALLCAYEICVMYVTAGRSASERYSPLSFFFGVSVNALAINMLFIYRMVFNGLSKTYCHHTGPEATGALLRSGKMQKNKGTPQMIFYMLLPVSS